MSYLDKTYQQMGVDLDPTTDYFVTDGRFLTLEKVLFDLPKGTFCDLGCGHGAIIRRLANHHEVYGTEYVTELVKHCQKDGLRVEQIDLNEAAALPFPGVSFDAILISEVLEHLLDPRHALGVANQALKDDGTLIVTVPNAVPLLARRRFLFGNTVDWLHYPSHDTEVTGHIRFYTIESMSRLLREAGFEVVENYGMSFRMNGHFWARVCYWLPKLTGLYTPSSAAAMDAWLGRMWPGGSPGLYFKCRKVGAGAVGKGA